MSENSARSLIGDNRLISSRLDRAPTRAVFHSRCVSARAIVRGLDRAIDRSVDRSIDGSPNQDSLQEIRPLPQASVSELPSADNAGDNADTTRISYAFAPGNRKLRRVSFVSHGSPFIARFAR
jgi:hypothetical protein